MALAGDPVNERIVDHVYEQLWDRFGSPTHPEDVANLRGTIVEVVAVTLAYLDGNVPDSRPNAG